MDLCGDDDPPWDGKFHTVSIKIQKIESVGFELFERVRWDTVPLLERSQPVSPNFQKKILRVFNYEHATVFRKIESRKHARFGSKQAHKIQSDFRR